MGVKGISQPVDSAAVNILTCKFCVVVFLVFSEFALADFNGTERDSLMKLQEIIDPFHKTILHKNWTAVHCYGNDSKWEGIRCSNWRATELFLDNMELNGSISADAFVNITELTLLSFKNSSLTGNLPDFSPLVFMHKLDFSDNKFNGTIPSSLVNLNQLEELYLQNNELSGSVPPFNQPTLKGLNISNNDLTGDIPDTPVLNSFNESAYLGNDLKRRQNLTHIDNNESASASPRPAPRAPPKTSHHVVLHADVITLISLVAAAAILVILLLFLSCYRRYKNRPLKKPSRSTVSNKKSSATVKSSANRKKAVTPKRMEELDTVSEAEKSKLLFFGDEGAEFSLEDLLHASAEMLGQGNFGSSYKAVLRNGSAMVVKRLKELNNLAKEEFEKHTRMLARLRHENLVPLSSYYYAEEEKLLIYNYMPNGNLFDLLHGTKKGDCKALDWKCRLKIAQSIARGVSYLHERWGSVKFIPHGNIKSSNILIDENNQPRIADYGLAPLISPAVIAQKMVAYNSPEYFRARKVSFKSDVWSFGILLLELLTGKVPSQYGDRSGVDLPRFVQTVVREEWTAEIFDREIAWQESSQAQMLRVLQIAMDCTHTAPEKRPIMSTVVRRLEEMEEQGSGVMSDDDHSVSVSVSVSDYDSSPLEYAQTPDLSIHSQSVSI